MSIGHAALVTAVFSVGISAGCVRDQLAPDSSPPIEGEAVFRGNAHRTGVFPSPGLEAEPTVLWKIYTHKVTTDAAVADGRVFFGTGELGGRGSLYAVDARTGKRLWKFAMTRATFSTPAVVDDLVLFGSRDGNVYALDAASGTVRWRLHIGNAVDASPAVVKGTMYFSSDNHQLFAVDVLTGQERWRFQTGAPIKSSPTVADGIVYFGSNDNRFYAVNGANGREVWHFETERNVSGTAAVSDGVVYFGSNDADDPLYALDAKTGTVRWRRGGWRAQTKGNTLSPSVAGAVVYFGVQEGNLYALDRLTGDQRWVFPSRVSSDVSAAGTMLCFVSYNGYLHGIDATTGQERWRFYMESPWGSAPALVDGVLFFGSEAGPFYAIVAPSRAP